jgi:integrase/recombinase XerD
LYRDKYSDLAHLFATIRGTALQVRNYDKTLKMTGDKVRVSTHPHQLRNNFAKYYLLNNGDWISLSRILGHSSAVVTQRAYLDFTNDETRKKYQKHSLIDFLNL